MQYVLGNMLNGGGGLNPDGLSLDLPFAATKSLTARVGPTPTFTRASSATFVGSNGLIQSAAINIPRFDHNPTSPFACRGLLIEESRTNSITGSNAFNTWTLGNTTVASSSVVTPEGTADAWKLVEDTLSDNHNATRPFTPVSGTTYTASVWLKPAENGFAFVGFAGGGFFPTFISVNLSTGAVSTAVGTTVGAASVAYSNGWWRVSFSLAATASLSSIIDIRLSRDGNWANRSYLGNGVNGMYVYGSQVEAGSFATSYIPTTTGSVVRSADVCSITGGDFNTVYNESEHTLFVQASAMSHANFGSYLSFDNGTASEQSSISGFPSPNRAVCYVVDGGTTQASPELSITLNQSNKIAAGMKLNSFQVAVNNATGTQDASGTMPTANTLKIGRAWNSATISGTYAQVKVFKKRLPNAKLVTLTT